jgi:integrase
VLIIDIRYRRPDGTKGRYRHDAEVQTLAAARAEDRRRLAALTLTGSPLGRIDGDAPAPNERQESSPKLVAREFPRFDAIAEDYLRTFATSQLKPSTELGYRTVLRSFLIPRIGDRAINMIDATTVRSLDAELVERGLKPSTRRQAQAVLRSVLCRYAVEAGILDAPPVFPRMPKVGRKVARAFTREEIDQLLAKTLPVHRVAFMLAAYAGLRAGEVRALRWRDVDLDGGRIIVRESMCHGVTSSPKSGHERVVPLTPELRDVLASVRTRKRDAFVAQTVKGGSWSEFGLLNAFRRACGRAGLEGWRLHDLRHFFVTELFRRGAPAHAVQALAGHADLATTQRYAHVARPDLEAAIARLGAPPNSATGATVGQQALKSG